MGWKEAVDLAKSGKEEGYSYLYQQTYQKSYYVALKYMKQEDAALDVLQDAYIKAFKNLEQLQDADKFSPWLSKIVATKALDELKKHKAVLFSQMETEDSTVESLFEDDRIDTQPELSLDKKETSRLVQEMINALSDEQRICVMMYYVEEMSVKDIAETLGVSENTVKSRLNYARKNIKEEVLELEKKGTKLYSLAPIPFFLYLLLSDTMNAQAAELPVNQILETATKEAVKAQQAAGANALSQAGGKTMGLMTKKVIIGIITTIVVGGGAIGGVLAYQNYQNQQAEEAMAIQKEEDRKEAEALALQQEEAERLEQEKLAEKATEEPTEQPTEEVTEQPTEAVTEEPTETAETAPQFTFTEMSATLYAKSSVNVRDLPDTSGNKLGGLSKAQDVTVTGQCNQTSWFRIEFNGSVGYVSNSYLVNDKPVATQPVENTNSGGSNTAQQPDSGQQPQEQPPAQEPASNPCPYELYTLVNFEDNKVGFYYIGNTPNDLCAAMDAAAYELCPGSGPNRSYDYVGTYDVGEVCVIKSWYIPSQY